LRLIVKALAKMGLAKEAREVATKALAASREIENEHGRAKELSSIAKTQAKAGMAMEALATAHEIKSQYNYHETLRLIFEALVEAEMAMEALATARKIEYASRRARVFLEVTDFWLERRQDDDARNLLEETQSTVSKVFDDEQRSWSLRDLTVILARLHSYRAAREAAEQCSSSSDRLAAYTAILREYHIERDPSLAQLFAEEKEEEEDD
jgi:hypothetical protein